MANETVRLAEYAAALRYEDIPRDVVERAKDCITDTVAVIVLGIGLPWSRIVAAYAQRIGAGGRSRILGAEGPTLQAPAAALANGTLAHAFESDNLTKPGAGVHPGATLLPPDDLANIFWIVVRGPAPDRSTAGVPDRCAVDVIAVSTALSTPSCDGRRRKLPSISYQDFALHERQS